MSNHRRKWSFEKGRSSSHVILAALITLLVTVVTATGFKYVRKSPDDQRQTTEVLLISGDEREFLQALSHLDPANIFGINNGGQPFCLICRRSHCASDPCDEAEFSGGAEAEKVEIPEYSSDVKAVPAEKMTPIPVTAIHAAVLPVPPEKDDIRRSHRIMSGNGRLFTLKKLDEVKAGKVEAATILQLSGSGLLTRVQIIRSCGNRELDFAAGRILKAAGTAPGIYTINWNRHGGN